MKARSLAGTDTGDRNFRAILMMAGVSVFVLLGAILVFLVVEAAPSIGDVGSRFFTEKNWFPDQSPPIFGVLALVFGTLLSSLLALLVAWPVALAAALVVVELVPQRLGRFLGYLVDLLATVPSVVFGLWGAIFLVPWLVPIEKWLDAWFDWIPLFNNRTNSYGHSVFAASVVLAIMILPIISALSREVFSQVPRSHKEAALALGATRWEMIRLSMLPFGRAGLMGAAMLGLGRAMGETIAVALVLSASFTTNLHVLEPGGNTIAANIATKFGEAGTTGRSALIASGLVLFFLTFVVNALARLVVRRNSIVRLAR